MYTEKQLMSYYRRRNTYKTAVTYVHTLPQVVFPMSMLHQFLTDEQIARYSECYDFDEASEYFHFSHDNRMLESCNLDTVIWHNNGMPTTDWLVFYEHLPENVQKDFVTFAKR